MRAQEKVLALFPEAYITREALNGWRSHAYHYRVTIKPGRYAYGRMKSWAWKSAYNSITQDAELSKGAHP